MTPNTKNNQNNTVWDWQDIWAAAALANRINGGYYKHSGYDSVDQNTMTQTRKPNREIMKSALENPSMIKQCDRETGKNARDWLSKDLLMKSLSQQISDFEQTVARTCSLESFDNKSRMELGVVASQIQNFIVKSRLQDVDNLESEWPVGTKGVVLDAEVVNSVYSQKWNTFYITAVTDENQSVFFSFREKIKPGTQIKIKGTIKAHRKDATQLTRVRRLDISKK